jgi:hypothetical protein
MWKKAIRLDLKSEKQVYKIIRHYPNKNPLSDFVQMQ